MQRFGGVGRVKEIVIRIHGKTFAEFCRQLQPDDYGCWGRDELAGLRQYGKESVADFISRFRATCLKIQDLSEAEKLDRFVHALVLDTQLQVELHSP